MLVSEFMCVFHWRPSGLFYTHSSAAGVSRPRDTSQNLGASLRGAVYNLPGVPGWLTFQGSTHLSSDVESSTTTAPPQVWALGDGKDSSAI